MLSAATLVLTLDILRVINNEVAVPHHWEIHRQLTDLHSFVQILDSRDGEKERKRWRDRYGGKGAQKIQAFQWEVWEFKRDLVLQMQHYVVPMLLQPYIIRELTEWETTRSGTAGQRLDLPFWPLQKLSLTASCALNSSLTFIVCEWECMRESNTYKMCLYVVPLGIYSRNQWHDWLEGTAQPCCSLLQCNYLSCIYCVSTD